MNDYKINLTLFLNLRFGELVIWRIKNYKHQFANAIVAPLLIESFKS